MKKILVLSDSHGNIRNMVQAVRETEPDVICHLGDCWPDAVKLRAAVGNIPLEQVPGNCDYQDEPTEKLLFVEGKKIMICHGHTYAVKSGYLTIELAAVEKGADLVLFGHTHKVFYDRHNKVALLNPGSIGSPGFMCPPSYGVLILDEETGQFNMDINYIETGSKV